MIRIFSYPVLLCLGVIAAASDSEVYYIIRPSESQFESRADRYSSAACEDNDLTLSQFVDNSSNYLTDDTTLMFSSGNYSLESELIVENIHSFSMFAWPASSSKAIINCDPNMRFGFRNVSIVTVSGLEFVGCFENYVVSASRFQLENSGFFGNGQAIVNGTALIIEGSVANLDKVLFIDKLLTVPQVLPENIYCSAETTNVVIGILLKSSNISIAQSWFKGNKIGLGAVIYVEFGSNIIIINTIFANNSATRCCSKYHNSCFAGGIVYMSRNRSTMKIYYSKFEGNFGVAILSYGDNIYTHTINIIHSEFVNNSVTSSHFPSSIRGVVSSSLVTLDGVMITVSLSKFINNRVGGAVVYMPYYTTAENVTNNVFIDNSAAYEVYINSFCRPGLGLSLSSSRCIQCSETWKQDLIGIVIAAFIAGIALVILILALNMTVAVGTLNGILFYANIVYTATNTDTFLPFTTPEFVTVFISWLNFDIGLDVCFLGKNENSIPVFKYNAQLQISKALIQLAFPAYVIVLVIFFIVASECSSKFAKIIGKGNPVAVLATMILLSYAKFMNTVFALFSLLYWIPARGSRNVDVIQIQGVPNAVEETNNIELKALAYFLLLINMLIILLCVVFTALIFSWQWLLRYQDKVIFKWMSYQKLRHFLEPYYAPYTAEYRYWTGLLLFVRTFLNLISLLNFSLDPRVYLMAVIFVIGGLIFLKGMIAKRVYKNWPLDVIETAIYFNLVAFSALTWYNVEFGGNQVAVAYMSVMIIFILLLGVIVFHILNYTKLNKCSLVEKAFKWISSKLLEKKPKGYLPNDVPEEMDGYRLERSAAGDQELPTITYSVIEISQPAQNQEENCTD